MSAPKRIQLRRTKGWRKPEGAVVVARPSKWGNPFRVVQVGQTWCVEGWGRRWTTASKEAAVVLAVDLYADAFGRFKSYGLPAPAEVAGRDLACGCPPASPCHADVLLDLANREDET